MTYHLGVGIGEIIPFHPVPTNTPIPIPTIKKQQTEFIINKLLITIAIVVIAKIAVLLLWPILIHAILLSIIFEHYKQLKKLESSVVRNEK